MNDIKLKSNLTIADIIGHGVIWILLVIVTLGLALFVYPYYLYRFVISKTVALDSEGREIGKLTCTIELATMVGNIVLWALLSLVTLGLCYFFFAYKLLAQCLSHTEFIPNFPVRSDGQAVSRLPSA